MVSKDIQGNRKRYLDIMHAHGTMSPDDIVASLTETQSELLAVFRSASDEQAARKPAPDEWSLFELARHTDFTERLIAKLIHNLARSGFPSAEDLEGSGLGMMPPDDGRTYAGVLDDLATRNTALLDAIRGLPDEPNLELQAPHPFFGPLNCKGWAGFQRVHDLDHIQHARKILAEM